MKCVSFKVSLKNGWDRSWLAPVMREQATV